MSDVDAVEPVECWVLTIPIEQSGTYGDWSVHAVTVEVYLTFDAYSERCDELGSMGVVSHTRHLMADRKYY